MILYRYSWNDCTGTRRHPLYVPGGIEPLRYEPWRLAVQR